jgi:hypothetical protein
MKALIATKRDCIYRPTMRFEFWHQLLLNSPDLGVGAGERRTISEQNDATSQVASLGRSG